MRRTNKCLNFIDCYEKEVLWNHPLPSIKLLFWVLYFLVRLLSLSCQFVCILNATVYDKYLKCVSAIFGTFLKCSSFSFFNLRITNVKWPLFFLLFWLFGPHTKRNNTYEIGVCIGNLNRNIEKNKNIWETFTFTILFEITNVSRNQDCEFNILKSSLTYACVYIIKTNDIKFKKMH